MYIFVARNRYGIDITPCATAEVADSVATKYLKEADLPPNRKKKVLILLSKGRLYDAMEYYSEYYSENSMEFCEIRYEDVVDEVKAEIIHPTLRQCNNYGIFSKSTLKKLQEAYDRKCDEDFNSDLDELVSQMAEYWIANTLS